MISLLVIESHRHDAIVHYILFYVEHDDRYDLMVQFMIWTWAWDLLVSQKGEALDEKTPHLRSVAAINS